MFWRLLYFKYEWWGCFLFVWSYSQWSLLHSVEKCLQFSCTECTKWFCQLIFFFVKRFIYFSVGRTQKLSAASTRVAETVTPLSSDLVEIFFFLGRTHTQFSAYAWGCCLQQKQQRGVDPLARQLINGGTEHQLPSYQWSAPHLTCQPWHCIRSFLQQSN